MLISGFNRLVLTDAHAHNVFYYYDPISKDFYVKLIDINFEAIGPHELLMIGGIIEKQRNLTQC